MRRLTWIPVLAGAGLLLGLGGASTQVPGPFTAAQATAGHAAYLENCAPCHNRTLQGGGEAPSLAGVSFIGGWSKRGLSSTWAICI